MKKINVSFFGVLIIFFQVILTDSIIYFLNLENYVLANCISFIINIFIVIALLKKKCITIENNFKKWDLVFLIILFIIICVTIVLPDVFWDTFSYHIYLQEKPFVDKINNDFFPGRTLTSFISPISDRVFFVFRFFLGYRLGTLPGYLLLIVMFYQIKKILKLLCNKINERNLSIVSIFPMMSYIILQQLGTYYIDNFCVVFLLELIVILLNDSEKLFNSRGDLYYLVLVVGIAFSIKITNVVYMFLPLMYIIIKNIKNFKFLKWYDYIIIMLLIIFPVFPYMIDSFIQTGSPVFPYYNTIFKSEYFACENWLDTRYGPKMIFEFIAWPIYIMFNPRRAYEADCCDLAFPIGYIISIIYLLYAFYKRVECKQKVNKKILLYSGILIGFYFLWEKFIIGYTRYAGIIIIMSLILLIWFIISFIEKKKNFLAFFLLSILILSVLNGIYNGIVMENRYRFYINGDYNSNLIQVYKDKYIPKYDIDGIWGVIDDDSLMPELLSVDDKLVHLEYGFKTGNSKKSNDIYWDNILKNDIYVPLYTFKLAEKIRLLNEYHYEIIEIKDVLNDIACIGIGKPVYIVKVKYNVNLEKNKNFEIFNSLMEIVK